MAAAVMRNIMTMLWNPRIVLAASALALWIAYQIVRAFLRHPLAKFSGPPIAACTRLYKTYVECIAQGSFVHLLEKHHSHYGESPNPLFQARG